MERRGDGNEMTIWILLSYIFSGWYKPAFFWVPSPAEQPTPSENLDLERRDRSRGGRSKGKWQRMKPPPPLPHRWVSWGLSEMFCAGCNQLCCGQGKQSPSGQLWAGLQSRTILWGYWGQNWELYPLGLTCNPAQAWSPALCLSSHMGSQAVADEVDLGRRVAVVCLEREDCILRTFLSCGFCDVQT